MEIARQLIDCLNENNVQYEILHHSEAVTAQRIAQAEHVKGRHQAKVVMVKAADKHLLMVLPANTQSIWRRSRKQSANPSHLRRKTNSNHSSPTLPSGPCRRLGIFMVCVLTWIGT